MSVVRLLNIGCGARPVMADGVVNLDNSAYARLKRNPLLRAVAPLLLSAQRRQRLGAFPSGVIVHDIRRPLPFASGSVAAVYHAHVLEHLDRDAAVVFMREVGRVLVPGGIHRVAVPDMASKCQAYLLDLAACVQASPPDMARAARHERFIAAIIEQSVRRESATARHEQGLRRWLDARLLGDARRRGETHQWMYDQVTLGRLFTLTGHTDAVVHEHDASAIESWGEYALERTPDGRRYRPLSLIMEARRGQ